jgi:uncharacterized protein YlxW (UPF0749 family)
MIEQLGQLGPIGIALVVLVIMWGLNRQSSKEYRLQIRSLRELVDTRDSDGDETLAELRAEIRALKEEIRELRADMATERELRRKAEETAHRLRMGGRDDPSI